LIVRNNNSYNNNGPPKSYMEVRHHQVQLPLNNEIKESGIKKSFEVEESKNNVDIAARAGH